jgi:hypothetical protein
MGCKKRLIDISYVIDDVEDFMIFRRQRAGAGFANVASLNGRGASWISIIMWQSLWMSNFQMNIVHL